MKTISEKLRNLADLLDKLNKEQFSDSKCVKVWLPKDCPKVLWDCFENHDDVDQVAFVPNGLSDKYLRFLECPSFGRCDVEWHDIGVGKIVVDYHS